MQTRNAGILKGATRLQVLALVAFAIVVALVLVFVNSTPARASVEFVGFAATETAEGVTLEWETAVELKTAGFYVYRATAGDFEPQQISEFIPAQGDAFTGATYTYTDADGSRDGYNYFIEVVDLDSTTEMVGPIRFLTQQTSGPIYLPLIVK